jgi:hypothetical protein
VLVAGARQVPAAPSGADQTKDGVILSERRNRPAGGTTTRAFACGVGRHESTTAPANAGKLATLNESPHRGTRHAERTPRFFNRDQVLSHTLIVSPIVSLSHRLSNAKRLLAQYGRASTRRRRGREHRSNSDRGHL